MFVFKFQKTSVYAAGVMALSAALAVNAQQVPPTSPTPGIIKVTPIDSPSLQLGQQATGTKNGDRRVEIVEDRNQDYMASKVYELKHVKPGDLTPFILGAVKRFNSASRVERLNYKFAKKQYIVVHTAEQMMPYVDDLVRILDRPGGDKDEVGAIIDGTGIYRFVYYTKYRYTSDMLKIAKVRGSSDGEYFADENENMLYWKDSDSDGRTVLEWLKALDRPVPQVELLFKVYEITDNDVKELGIDYVSWKNGPGAELFGFGADMFNFRIDEQFLANGFDLFSSLSNGWAGIMFAPQFDASFLRMLDQKGKTNAFTSGSITVVNDFDGSYNLTLVPGYQNIEKTDLMEVSVGHDSDSTFALEINNPTICFQGGTIFKATRHDPEGSNVANLMFGYKVSWQNVIERNNVGTEFMNNSMVESNLTLQCGTEKLLAEFTREHDVNQYNGIPFLGDIPGIKYLVGADTHSKAYAKYFVTVEATPVKPSASLSEWAGKIISDAEMIKKSVPQE